MVGTDYSAEDDELTELDDEFLVVASQVPVNYMGEAEALNGETTMPGLNNLNDLLAALNTCVRWIAWIGVILVVGSARAGDADDEDPPPPSAALYCRVGTVFQMHREGQQQWESSVPGSAKEPVHMD